MNRRRDFVADAASRADRLRGTAYLLCGDWHTAEDLTQMTLTKLYVAWPRVRRQETVDPYARQVLVRTFLDEKRRSSSGEIPVATTPDFASAEGGPESRIDLVRALAKLPSRQRAVLILRFFEDLDVTTVAGGSSGAGGPWRD